MIRLNSDYVHYLNLSNLKEFSNLTLISLPDGELFRMNPITLAAFGARGRFMVSRNIRKSLSNIWQYFSYLQLSIWLKKSKKLKCQHDKIQPILQHFFVHVLACPQKNPRGISISCTFFEILASNMYEKGCQLLERFIFSSTYIFPNP